MADGAAAAAKHAAPVIPDLKSLISVHKTRRTVAFLYGFMFASIVVTVFFAFSPSPNSAAPWLTNVFSVGNNGGDSARGSQFPSIFSYLFPNGSSPSPPRGFSSAEAPPAPAKVLEPNSTRSDNAVSDSKTEAPAKNQTSIEARNNATAIPSPKSSDQSKVSQLNQTTTTTTTTKSLSDSDKSNVSQSNQTVQSLGNSDKSKVSQSNQTVDSLKDSEKSKVSQSNQTAQSLGDSEKSKASRSNQTAQSLSNSGESKASGPNHTEISTPKSPPSVNKTVGSAKKNETALVSEEKKSSGASSGVSAEQGKKVDDSLESLRKCDLFDGRWVRDDSYGLYYKPGSCSLIDEQFNCVPNGRPDKDFLKFKWKPKGCSLPRLDGKKMLEMLRGKRLVFVGDSLNRNMWESLVCILKNSAKNQSNVFEAHGRSNFRNEASYSFIFQDYKCTVEFFVTPFLVQEEKVKAKNGKEKEYLHLDTMSHSARGYKTADIIVFNTGHWWTHDKTSKGEDYYKEGGQVYKKLNVFEAFRKAMTTWANWVDANVNPTKSLLFFRGYSHSHFSGGQWNSGGACDSETVPISNETFLRPYLPKMIILEKVLEGMKSPVTYLNVTKMTDFRKDGHPSMYRKQNIPEEEMKSPLKYQDCSHWCLPGVPDTWNEMLYAGLLVKFGQKGQQKQQEQKKS